MALLALAASGAYLTRHCLAVANTTIQEELGFNNEQFGYLFSAFSLGYLIFQIPGGWAGERFGTRPTLPLIGIAWSALTLVTAAVTTLSAMVTTRFAFGVAQAGLIPNLAKVVKDWFPLRSRARASAIIATSMSAGSVLTMALTAWLMDLYPWRVVFRFYSIVGLAWGIAFYMLFRTRPEQHPWTNEAERNLIEGSRDTAKPTAAQPSESSPRRAGGLQLVRNISIWALSCQLVFKAAGYNLFVVFFPAFLELAYGIKKSQAGMLTVWPLLGVITGSLASGVLIDGLLRTTGSKRISRCGVAIASMLMTAGFMCASTFTSSAQQMAAVVAVGAVFCGMAIPCSWTAVIDVGGKRSGVVMGIVNCVGNLAGVVITPLVGRLIDHIKETDGDWNQVIYLHAAFYVIAAVCWLAVHPERTIDS